MRPLLLQYGDEDQVELVQEGSLGLEGLLGARALDDELDDEVSDACMSKWRSARVAGESMRSCSTNLGTGLEEEPSIWS